MTNILILYSTTDGHTIKICQTIQSFLEQKDHAVELHAMDQGATVDPNEFDKLVIGASIRYGKHQQLVYDYIAANLEALESKPAAFFSVNVVARKPDKNQPDTNPYMKKFLQQIKWRPDELAVFAGKIDYPKYRFFDRNMIRLIMFLTKGPTDTKSVTEFTDWQQVEGFAKVIGSM